MSEEHTEGNHAVGAVWIYNPDRHVVINVIIEIEESLFPEFQKCRTRYGLGN
jgi:hypothetical protein